MAAPDNAKLQANFKLADGTLINVYAASAEEFEALLTTVQDSATLIQSTSVALGGSTPRSTTSSANTQSAAQAAAIVGAGAGSSPVCAHGPMNWREGVGAKGPWKGWMCSAPKGSANKCETIWSK